MKIFFFSSIPISFISAIIPWAILQLIYPVPFLLVAALILVINVIAVANRAPKLIKP